MKKFIFFLAFFSFSINASVIIGSPNVEINTEGLYLVKIKISSNNSIAEDKILLTNFKSDDELSDFEFEYQIFENLEDYIRLTLAIPNTYPEDYISFRLSIKEELKKDIFIFLPQNDLTSSKQSEVSFKLPAKKIYGEPERYDIARILSEDQNYDDSDTEENNTFSLVKPINSQKGEINESLSIPSDEVETIWSVSTSVSKNYDASIYQIMWGFYLENPNAFIDEDINLVRGDVDLNLPSQELVASTSNVTAKESIAFMGSRQNLINEPLIQPILKLTAPTEIFNDSEGGGTDENTISSSNLISIQEIDNSGLTASEIVQKNTSFISLNTESDYSSASDIPSNARSFGLQDLFWVGLISLFIGFVIAYMLIKYRKSPVYTKSALEEDLLDENNTFQTNLSVSNDIETQELDLVRTYLEMGDWQSATKILDKLIANSSNDSIVSEARLLLKEKK
ncbi:MAG: hypothetical protein DBW98_03365 [SAR86 cluster bacterium]|uniref:Protein BatD n=1 Tax=SAR86 cluster bacterium TaxID=2030880 RepID=A0A368BM84_9GAMM|nr:MAG: hypothetical protein DBW98_03365 [SAR86 cluster bacterium]